jgi:tetratricopeptide (TPR) repeat protein
MAHCRYAAALLCASIWLPALCSASPVGPHSSVVHPAYPAMPLLQTRNRQGELKAMMIRAFDLIEAGQLDEAQKLLDSADELNRSIPGRVEDRALSIATDRAKILVRRGAFDQAETLLKQIVVAVESRHGLNSDWASDVYTTLGDLYMREARWEDAERYIERAVEVVESATGKSSPSTGEMLNELAIVYMKTSQWAKAEPILLRALKIFSAMGATGKDDVAAATLNLGTLYQYTDRPKEALSYFGRAFALDTQIYGSDHPNTILAMSNAAVLLELLQRYDEALPLMEQAFAATRRRSGDDNPQTAHAGNNVGWVKLGQRDFAGALAYFRPALAIYFRQRDIQMRGAQSRGAAIDEREVSRTILGLARAAHGLSETDPSQASNLSNEAFIAVQRVHRGVAAQAFALASARFAAGDGPLAQLIRQRQDDARRWLDVDKTYTAVLASPTKTRDPGFEREARATLDGLQSEIQNIDAKIATSFPAYGALAEPQPLSIAEARAILTKDEALVLFAPFGGSNGEDLFTFVVDADGVSWRSAGIGATDLTVMVQTLRCGLDIGQWDKETGRALCAKLVRAPTRDDPLPFSTETAHKIFSSLFGELAPRLVGKTLYVVAPDPLASLPLQVLLTAPPTGDGSRRLDLQKAQWLSRTSTLVVLPAAANLRQNAAASTISNATEPFVGFGNPLLPGAIDCPSVATLAACPDATSTSRNVSLVSRGPASVSVGRRTASGLADLDAVRSLCPLPDTALELRCVAQSLRAPAETIHVGAGATLAALRSTQLDHYRVVHFATHGLLAGEIGGTADAEPALVLTPPESAQPNDDGLLRASEIAGLKLNADWVVLSACNTAAGANLGGEAMSGLASAFFYAGARTLLASHWPVRSDAAVLLTTRAFEQIASTPAMGKAEAMRLAMLSLIDDPSLSYAHPSVWAPFVVAGDGGSNRH